LTAQHQDDQAETLLLQLFRGGGAAGLASMPDASRFSMGWHLRPLLSLTRAEIEQYAQLHGLTWVNDPSNQDVQYDRNYLRQRIFPLLKRRWPGIEQTLSRAAQQQAENNDLLEQLANIDLNDVMQPDGTLSVTGLSGLSEARQRNLLRFWIIQQQLPVPPRRIVQQILQQMLTAKVDAQPCVCWSGCEIHRFKGRLDVFASLIHDVDSIFDWSPEQPLLLSHLNQQLRMRSVTSTGLSQQVLTQPLQVRFRRGGETIQPAGRQGHHSLKKLFQEQQVPPWLRSRIPLIYLGNELIAVAGYFVANGHQAATGEPAYWPEVVSLTIAEQGLDNTNSSRAPSD
jgi:tRNA(Ile)-lysidine synthase